MLVLAMEFSRGVYRRSRFLTQASVPDGVRAAGHRIGRRHRTNIQETKKSLPQNETVRPATRTSPGIGAGRASPCRDEGGRRPPGSNECRITSDRLGVPDQRSGVDSLERR
jgi:hypothetical protein